MHIFHDWITVESEDEETIIEAILAQFPNARNLYPFNEHCGEYNDYTTNFTIRNRICKKCGKIDNDLDQYRIDCKRHYEREYQYFLEREAERTKYKKIYDDKMRESNGSL